MLNRSEEILQSIRGRKPTAEVLEFGESPERKAFLDAPVECEHGQVARREQRMYKAKVNAATYWLASWYAHLGEAEMSNDQAHIDLCQAKIKHYLAVLHDAEIYIKNCAEKRGEATVEMLPNSLNKSRQLDAYDHEQADSNDVGNHRRADVHGLRQTI